MILHQVQTHTFSCLKQYSYSNGQNKEPLSLHFTVSHSSDSSSEPNANSCHKLETQSHFEQSVSSPVHIEIL